jgi:hypothetical protein
MKMRIHCSPTDLLSRLNAGLQSFHSAIQMFNAKTCLSIVLGMGHSLGPPVLTVRLRRRFE